MKISSFLIVFLLIIPFFGVTQKNHFDKKPFVKGEMLIQLAANKSIKALLLKAPIEYNINFIKELSPPMRISLISFDHKVVSHEDFQSWLYSQDEITVADYNYYVKMRSTLPSDPSFTSQWHHNNTGNNGGTLDADIDSDLAWDITTGGTTATNDDIVVCMVEGGGGNLDHLDLSPNRWVNTGEIPNDNIDNDGNGYVDDYNGWNTGSNNDDYGNASHGTNCLGLIGAKGNNNIDVTGANWDVKMMVLNMGGNLTQASVVSAYTYPLIMRQKWNNSNGTQGAFVVATSSSWGIDRANSASYPLWCQFYDTLGHYGILNVCATTNSNLDVDVIGDMPTGCSSNYMVGVGRTDNQDQTAGGYGNQTILLGAPGINVVTTNGTGFGASGTTSSTGTSFACPLTAGVIGLAYSIPCPSFMTFVKSDAQAAADLVLQALINGTDPKTQLSSRFITGGRLNSRNTLDSLMKGICSPCGMSVVSTITHPQCSGIDNGAISVSVSGGIPDYTYNWIGGLGTDSTINNLSDGNYTLIVSDSSLCDTIINYDLNYLPSNINITSTVNDPQCLGIDNGSISVSGIGSSGYSLNWGSGLGSDSGLSNLSATSYSLLISDTLMCDTTIVYDLSYITTVGFSSSYSNITCNGANDGVIVVNPSGSSGYNFIWSGSFGNVSSINGLSAGVYTLDLSDTNGCTKSATFTITEPQPAQPQSSFTYSINNLTISFINTSDNGLFNWDFGDGTFSSSFGSRHDYDSSGTYNVCLTLITNCDTVTFCETITIEPSSSVNLQEGLQSGIKVYPNPAANTVFFSINNLKARNLYLIDPNGKVVESRIIRGSSEEINLTRYSSGIYTYQITDNLNKLIKSSRLNIIK